MTPGLARDLGLPPDCAADIGRGSVLILRERDPARFLARFFAAVDRGCSLWLASPDWGARRMAELETLAAEHPMPSSIMIPSGGTTGLLRFAVHDWDTLRESAEGFLDFFAQRAGHRALCVLPLHHVSGLMQAVRVAVAGGRLAHGDAHAPQAGLPDGFEPEGFFISLVPTQLVRLMDDGAADWLRRFACILLGGAAADAALLERARAAGLPISPCYGMSETAALVAALKPEDFLREGASGGVGKALPHVQISIEAAEPAQGGRIVRKRGETLAQGDEGRIVLRAGSLCKALIPGAATDPATGLRTSDRGLFDARGRLHVLGRMDRVIVSGGLKLDPEEIEKALMDTGTVKEVTVQGMPDQLWGEAATAFYVPKGESCTEAALREHVRKKLSPAHVPKRWIRLAALPRNEAGKISSADCSD
ncbi:MAG: AMP-binding protein [Opitutales bacterium]